MKLQLYQECYNKQINLIYDLNFGNFGGIEISNILYEDKLFIICLKIEKFQLFSNRKYIDYNASHKEILLIGN